MTSTMTIEIDRLTPAIGAEISGVDLRAPLTPTTRDEIHQALLDHHVIFFRDQDLDHEQLMALGRQFGTLTIGKLWSPVGGHPEVVNIFADAKTKYVAGEMWHSDMTCTPVPPMGSILAMKIVPPNGGDTLWANMYAAYDALSQPMKDYLSGLSAAHDAELAVSMAPDGVQDAPESSGEKTPVLEQVARPPVKVPIPHSVHPVIRTHPETGRKLIFVNPFFTTHLIGVEAAESQAILQYLYNHCADPLFSVRFRWRANSVAFWDNRCTQHRALKDYLPHTRSGYRVQIDGDVPV